MLICYYTMIAVSHIQSTEICKTISLMVGGGNDRLCMFLLSLLVDPYRLLDSRLIKQSTIEN